MLRPFLYKTKVEAGLDEAGRGCFAGPVVAAAVILPKSFYHPLLNDSKQLTEEERNELRPIIEKEAVSYSVAFVDNDEIDRINILQASFKAMHIAVEQLKRKPNLLLVDGNRFLPYKDTKHKCIVKGDGIFMSIAAASVLAKTYRDEYMVNLHKEFSFYGWNSNKGYGTPMHREAIREKGICRYHRKTFSMLGDFPIPDEDQIALHLHEELTSLPAYSQQ